MNRYQFKLFFSYLSYLIYRPHREGHGIHSPFLFDYMTSVLNNRSISPQLKEVLNLRQQLLKDISILQVEDLGAGARNHRNHERRVKNIIRYSSTVPKYAKLLHHTVAHFQPKSILELGTCLGLGTAYLATACPTAKVITVEGSNHLFQRSRENFDLLKINNIFPVNGNFQDILPQIVKEEKGFDMVFMDGNHRKEATLNYFETLLPCMNSNSMVILDDIRWSEEMFEAWQKITEYKQVRLSLDLFQLGIVFFNEKLQKQHFQIYY